MACLQASWPASPGSRAVAAARPAATASRWHSWRRAALPCATPGIRTARHLSSRAPSGTRSSAVPETANSGARPGPDHARQGLTCRPGPGQHGTASLSRSSADQGGRWLLVGWLPGRLGWLPGRHVEFAILDAGDEGTPLAAVEDVRGLTCVLGVAERNMATWQVGDFHTSLGTACPALDPAGTGEVGSHSTVLSVDHLT